MPAAIIRDTVRGSRWASLLLLGLVGAGVAAGCHDPASPEPPAGQPLGPVPHVVSALVQATNGFSLDLFRAVEGESGPDSNVFISPLSASVALGMTATGANGATLDSMQAVLGYPGESIPVMDEAYQSLLQRLANADPHVDLRLASALWYDDSISLLPTFASTLQTDFAAHTSSADFTKPAAIDAINAWADSATLGLIPHFLNELPIYTKVFLANAVYFHGAWSTAFDPNKTRDTLFTTATGSTAAVQLMNATIGVASAQGADYVAADLPYASGAFTMTIVVPTSNTTLATVVDEMAHGGWSTLTATLVQQDRRQMVAVALPKFDVAWSGAFNDPLAALGMGIAFTRLADFSNMTHTERLKIDEVMQGTRVTVNEQGTTAAGVTGVGMGPTDVAEPTLSVRADRPFMYAIRERSTGAVLFLGAFTHPPAGSESADAAR